MKRLIGLLIGVLLAFAPVSALAADSFLLIGVGKAPSGGGGSGYIGPGDVVSGAKAWYGLRAYSAATATANAKAVALTRASDSRTCDVLLATTGGLGVTANCSTGGDNGTAVATWCGTCTINTIYDQIGAANAPPNPGAATLTFSCLGSLPCMTFGGSQGYEIFSGTSTTLPPLTISAVAERTGNFSAANSILGDANGLFFYTPNAVGSSFGTLQTATATDSAWHAFQTIASSGTPGINVDGTFSGFSLGTNSLGTDYYIGNSPGGSKLTGAIAEVGFWPAAFTSGQQTSMNANQHSYWGF